MNNTLTFVIMFSGIWAFIGIIFFITGISILNNKKKKEKNCTIKTYAKVTDMVKHKTYDNDSGHTTISWHPVIEYNIGELKIKKESAYGSYQSKYTIGQDVEIYYNPKNHSEFYIPGDNIQKILSATFTIIGIFAIIIAIVSAILMLQK